MCIFSLVNIKVVHVLSVELFIRVIYRKRIRKLLIGTTSLFNDLFRAEAVTCAFMLVKHIDIGVVSTLIRDNNHINWILIVQWRMLYQINLWRVHSRSDIFI